MKLRATMLLIGACVGSPLVAQQQKLPRTEVLVLADLSDRIDPRLHPRQVDRDTAIVRMIATEFSGLVRRNRYLFSHDRLRMLFLGGENDPSEPRVDVERMNLDHRVVVKELPGEIQHFEQEALRPYQSKRHQYLGADIWSWFTTSAQKNLQVDDPARAVRTRIILLTDGYLEFASTIHREPGTAMQMGALRGKANWEQLYPKLALAPVGYKLPETKVLVLELSPVNPTVNTTERQVVERYWRDWFGKMGVESEFLAADDALPSVNDAIRQFLSK